MRKTIVISVFWFVGISAGAQVGINTTSPQALLDIPVANAAAPANTDGILIPRITAFPTVNPTAAQHSMMVFLTTVSGTNQPGFYYWNQPTLAWVKIAVGNAGTLDQAYDFGGVGAGRTITADSGPVLINGVDGFVSTGTQNFGALMPTIPAGVRMFWYPRKVAFRAGRSINNELETSIGQASASFGATTTASGDFSMAWNVLASATGMGSTAFGVNSLASGLYATAFGDISQATAENSTAFGRNSIASGFASTAFGNGNSAASYGETTIGIGAINYIPSLNGNTQFRSANATDRLFTIGNAIDLNNNNYPDDSERRNAMVVLKNGNVGFGSSTPQERLHVEGKIRMVDGTQAAGRILTSDVNGTASWADPGSVFGQSLDASYDFPTAGAGRTITADTGAILINGTDGIVSTGVYGSGAIPPAIGTGSRMFWNPRKSAFRSGFVLAANWDNANVGDFSAGFGYSPVASGAYSFGAGYSNTISGNGAAAFGLLNEALAIGAVSFGQVNSSTGSYSFTMAYSNTASGLYSTAFGRWSRAYSCGEVVIGIGSQSYTPSAGGATGFGTANLTDRLFVIGNALDANDNGIVDNGETHNALVMLKNGNLGLNQSNPQESLHVNGKVRIVDGTQGVGRLLTSDANGTASWSATNTIASGTLDQAYDFGGAGLGRVITADAGPVQVSGNAGLQVTGTFNSGPTLDLSGPGTRMFFYPRKAAFRSGFAQGNQFDDVNIGNYSLASGHSSIATGFSSTAMGFSAIASGNSAVALGYNAVSTGHFAFAVGYETTASGPDSRAIGQSSTASGANSVTLGSGSVASGNGATTINSLNTAAGNNSIAAGQGNISASFGESVFGLGATIYTPSTDGDSKFGLANQNDRLFVIGNAMDANNNSQVADSERSNALLILKNGRVGVGIDTNAGIGGQFQLSLDQGRKPGTNTWTIASDERLKTIHGNFEKGLLEITQLQPIRYNYKNLGERIFEEEVLRTEFSGFSAQQVQQIFPEAVGTDDDGYLNLNIHPILIASVNAFKELKQQNDTLQEQNQTLAETVKRQQEMLDEVMRRIEKLETQNPSK
ncbi:MAG: hypothetical protein EOO50_00835 [Flavobacterium sp.]|uniref:tail fiber domain-containing protein n=1 Tax=Flavobacterium sp. TaxID=239 RepID=UPI001206C097|nr:tail fiber domain-containing protein [Flavobacterium sp.]RZJ68757.1 MAG: hypothetical protein EOO50_00835 [Flavobacterium sp.]